MHAERPDGGTERAATSLRCHLAAGDAAALVVAWGLQAHTVVAGWGLRVACAGVAIVVTLVTMERSGLFRSRVCALRGNESIRILGASMVGAASFAAVHGLVAPAGAAGPLEGAATAFTLLVVLRWRFGRWLQHRRAEGRYLRRVVLVGTNDDAVSLWNVFADEPELGYRVAAVAGAPRDGAPWSGLPSSPRVTDVAALARRTHATGVIVVGTALRAAASASVVRRSLAAGLHLQVWPGPSVPSSRRVRLVPVSGIPLFYVESPRAGGWQLAVKRAIDIAAATMLAVLTAPLLLVAVVLIKAEDRGPLLYRSHRIGRFGKTIVVYKLRTMVPDAAKLQAQMAGLNDRKGGPLFKASRDPRVTRVGRLLREASIDELPQLWNVFNGTMSLVGPRPALPSEAAQFDPGLWRRHRMRPGITGLWQIEARDNPSFSAYRRLDLSYIDDWSLRLDFAIMASTVHAVLVRSLRVLPFRTRRTGPAEQEATWPSPVDAQPPEPLGAELVSGEPA